ncbi:MAG: type II toxin-antitoxin system HicB family antitoxin [Acidobacteriota bacterium]|nr:type II toxin-antitoxin system HicB family antitoxin [Acidobacteriota bacterium]
MKRKVILYRGENDYIVAEVPSLQGVVSQGKSREEALRNFSEAVSLHIEVLQERGFPIPLHKEFARETRETL